MSDIISRKLAIELLENTIAMTKKEERRRNYCVELIKAMPSAYPKKGKWIKADSQQYFRKHYPCFTCSECGYRKDSQKKWNYCPNCGARMDEE